MRFTWTRPTEVAPFVDRNPTEPASVVHGPLHQYVWSFAQSPSGNSLGQRPVNHLRRGGGVFTHPGSPRSSFWVVVILFLLSSLSLADEKPLTIETSTMQPSVVLGRPMLTWWDVKIKGSGLVVGQFQFFIRSEDQLLATAETEELTLNGPDQRIRVMLPAIDAALPLDRLNVNISFRGKKFSGPVSEQILRVPFSSKKVFVGLVGESRTVRKKSQQRDTVMERLRFEAIIPKVKNNRGVVDDHEYVKTFFASIDPADLPSEALAYCSYDIVVLMGEEFRTLRKPQLEALLAWIKAGGGAVCRTEWSARALSRRFSA